MTVLFTRMYHLKWVRRMYVGPSKFRWCSAGGKRLRFRYPLLPG